MTVRSIDTRDDARPDSGAPLRPLIAFAADAVRFAALPNDANARRLACAPYSGLAKADARALCAVAGERATLVETIERDRTPLARAGKLAAAAFARNLTALASAYRAQGCTALGLVREAVALFALADDGERARATVAALEGAAHAVDAAAPPADASWNPAALVAAFERVAARAPRAEPSPAQPLPRRARETPSPVRRRKTHFSASSLGAYAECARKWYYRYVCAAVEDKGSSASFYGTAVHWALEQFHKEILRADQAPREELERHLEAWMNSAFERYRAGFATPVELDLQRRRARRTVKRYIAWFVARSRREPFAVLATEETAELVLDGYDFIGFIDRLDRSDATGAVTVIDYKTGSIAENACDYLDAVAGYTDFQLPLYYWARTARGERVGSLALVPLKDPLRDVVPIELEVVPQSGPRPHWRDTTATIGIDVLERARAKMIDLARTLSDAPIEHFPVTADASACTYCAYRLACRERPQPGEDRFGR